MKKILFILFNALTIICAGQQYNDSTTARINLLVEKTKHNTITSGESSELRRYIFNIQNKGFVLEEKQQDYSNALAEIDKALSIWKSIGDTLSIANLQKYKGYLYGKLKQFEKGKSELRSSIELFKIKSFDAGVAVSQHDFSLLYAFENNIDSALYYEIASNNFWITRKDTLRIVVGYIQLIYLYQKKKNIKQAVELQQLSNAMLNNTNTQWLPLINFYYVSYKLYEETKNNKLTEKYKKLYSTKIAELKEKNIIAKSNYE